MRSGSDEIGPGVYDIHSPRVPNTDETENLLIGAPVLERIMIITSTSRLSAGYG
jgi:methionine synthase II (cobalamin-independent)